MICPGCSTQNQDDFKFCRECGQRLATAVPVAVSGRPVAAPASRPPAAASPSATLDEAVQAGRLLDQAFDLYDEARYQEALGACQAALALDPSGSTAHSLLGMIYEKLGKTAEAVQHVPDRPADEPGQHRGCDPARLAPGSAFQPADRGFPYLAFPGPATAGGGRRGGGCSGAGGRLLGHGAGGRAGAVRRQRHGARSPRSNPRRLDAALASADDGDARRWRRRCLPHSAGRPRNPKPRPFPAAPRRPTARCRTAPYRSRRQPTPGRDCAAPTRRRHRWRATPRTRAICPLALHSRSGRADIGGLDQTSTAICRQHRSRAWSG